ncbi:MULTISPECIES: hypothetical protein [Microbacterium]|uniref:Polysaccharide chain length determinant N-terminal domain-containing protein n=1 Tax=Microbacterium wangchenii TaxID=2541726 RepID=A0ABX5SNT7_9MICO|nr:MULTISPECIES: hypothetical protein [Microbacterium]MCK6068070.1 hypothetical protein [Microbacterium sp. EYE_512]QBR87803.1 hypothetical protein E4K62_03270 [Microbacterium wangchenii]TXK16096.1 hypothetical protein FVP99_11505 [Microbacterium wangchenii]
MTFRDLIAALARRWYVLVATAAAAALLTVLFIQDGGVYSTKTVVTFTLPAASTLEADNGSKDASVIAFAGAVSTEINRGRPTPRYSSGDAPFYGAGVREGVLVSLRDDGSQWAPNYGSAIIDIQIVGRTEAWVFEQQSRVLTQIGQVVDAQLGAATAAADERIVAHVEPLTMRIDFIAPSRTAQLAAFATMSVAALLAGGWGAVTFDLLVRRRKHRHAALILSKGVTA